MKYAAGLIADDERVLVGGGWARDAGKGATATGGMACPGGVVRSATGGWCGT